MRKITSPTNPHNAIPNIKSEACIRFKNLKKKKELFYVN